MLQIYFLKDIFLRKQSPRMRSELLCNPADSEVNPVITSPTSKKATSIVTHIIGKVIAMSALQLTAGDNLQKLSVSQLTLVSYFIRTARANGCGSALQKY